MESMASWPLLRRHLVSIRIVSSNPCAISCQLGVLSFWKSSFFGKICWKVLSFESQHVVQYLLPEFVSHQPLKWLHISMCESPSAPTASTCSVNISTLARINTVKQRALLLRVTASAAYNTYKIHRAAILIRNDLEAPRFTILYSICNSNEVQHEKNMIV